MKYVKIFLVAVVAAACLTAVSAAQETTVGLAVTSNDEQAVEGQQSMAVTMTQVAKTVSELKAELREKRLAVLKELEAGKTSAEEALDALDALPAPPSRYSSADGRLVMVTMKVKNAGENEVQMSMPLPVVLWVIEAGPKLMDEQMAEGMAQVGVGNIGSLDLSGLSMALESLSVVTKPVTLVGVTNGENTVTVTVEPH